MQRDSYQQAGVDIAAGDRAVDLMRKAVASTVTPGVLGDIGGFGGCFQPNLAGVAEPVLVAGTDGVGTKLKIAFMTGRHDTVGIDCVAMCANDVAAMGADPLFFLDYIALGRLVPERVAEIVGGVAAGCRQAHCALVGGETAEMPGFYPVEEYDLAGFCVGLVDRSHIVDGHSVHAGDVLVGLPSSGLHSNGFSLVRHIVFDQHDLDVGAWQAPPVFDWLTRLGMLEEQERYQTFNMGLGFVFIVPEASVDSVCRALAGDGACAVGRIVPGDPGAVSYTHLRAHETRHDLVCRLLLEK